MESEINWAQRQKEADDYAEKQLRDVAANGSVNQEFFGVAIFALNSARNDELMPAISKYESINIPFNRG